MPKPTAAAKLAELLSTLTTARDQAQADLDAAQQVLAAEPPAPFDEAEALRRGAVARAQDAADGGSRLATVAAEIGKERQAVERALAADRDARDAARRTVAKRQADLAQLTADIEETDRLIRLEVQRAARLMLDEPREAYVAHLVGLVEALARHSALVALANDASDIPSARVPPGFELSVPRGLIRDADIPAAWQGRVGEVHVDRYEGARLASEAYQSLRKQLIEG